MSRTKKPALSSKERMRLYRQRLKEDLERYEAHKAAEAARNRKYRANRGEEVKQLSRLKNAEAVKRYRTKKQQSAEKEATRRQTRKDEKERQKLREYNRLTQQRQRANLSGRKKAEINKRRQIDYAEKTMKTKVPAAPSSLISPPSLVPNASDPSPVCASSGALKKAVHRARGKIKASRIRLNHILRGLIKTKDPETRKHLDALKTSRPSASKLLKTALKSTSHKRDKKTLIARRNLLAFFTGGNEVPVSPYKPSTSTNKAIVEDYFSEVAIPLPAKMGVNKKILDRPIRQIFKTFANTSHHKLSLRTFFR